MMRRPFIKIVESFLSLSRISGQCILLLATLAPETKCVCLVVSTINTCLLYCFVVKRKQYAWQVLIVIAYYFFNCLLYFEISFERRSPHDLTDIEHNYLNQSKEYLDTLAVVFEWGNTVYTCPLQDDQSQVHGVDGPYDLTYLSVCILIK